jgi:DNA-directed RNA polymerase II subunit RPB2
VLVDGNLVAFSKSFPRFVGAFKECRKKGLLSDSISVVADISGKEIRINTDAGRCMRPLLVVEENRLILTPQHL